MGLDRIIPTQQTPLPLGLSPCALDERVVRQLADAAGESLQEIQRRLGRSDHDAKVRFPRGYLIEIGRWRMALAFVRSRSVMNNVAYTLMMYDAITWMLRRTDIAGTARDMMLKASVTALGSIAEAVIVDATSPPMGRRQRITSRIARLHASTAMSHELPTELIWLWDTRNRQHLSDLGSSEFDFYEAGMLPRAEDAVVALVQHLQRPASCAGRWLEPRS